MQALSLASKLLVLACLLLAILFVDRSHHSSSSVDGNQMARVKYLRGLIAQAQSELAQLSVLERNVPEPERSVLRRVPSLLNPLGQRMPPTSDQLRQWFASIAADLGKQIESRTSTSYEEPHTNKYKVDVSSLRTVAKTRNADGSYKVDVKFNVEDKSPTRSGQRKWKCTAQITYTPGKSTFYEKPTKVRPFRLVKGNCDGLTSPAKPILDPSDLSLISLVGSHF